MTTIILIVHLLIALALVGVILLQRSEGGALGIGGGGMGGMMTGRASANLLTRVTAVLAAGFIVTSLLLAILAAHRSAPSSILDQPARRPGLPCPPTGRRRPVRTGSAGSALRAGGAERAGRRLIHHAAEGPAPASGAATAMSPAAGRTRGLSCASLLPDTPGPHDALRLHHRRRGVVPGQRLGLGGDRRAAAGARLFGPPAQARPLPQRRSGHDEPLPARRGLRHRRRRRDRSRSRPLRALHRRAGARQRQRHGGPDLLRGAGQGAARRLSRRHGPGGAARDRHDQAVHPARSRRHRLPALRDRRHGRRHRGPAVSRGDPAARLRARPRPGRLSAPDAGAVPRLGRRAEDQADPAFGARAARHRHPAGPACSAAPSIRSRPMPGARSRCSAASSRIP